MKSKQNYQVNIKGERYDLKLFRSFDLFLMGCSAWQTVSLSHSGVNRVMCMPVCVEYAVL